MDQFGCEMHNSTHEPFRFSTPSRQTGSCFRSGDRLGFVGPVMNGVSDWLSRSLNRLTRSTTLSTLSAPAARLVAEAE